MQMGICNLSVIPVRAETSEKSEMTTQILFGELLTVNEQKGSWSHVRLVYDNYEGWVDTKMIIPVDEEVFHSLNYAECGYNRDLIDVIKVVSTGQLFPILLGSSIRNINDKIFSIGNQRYEFEGELSPFPPSPDKNGIMEMAQSLINAPYLWGGCTPFGIDCSGFTQLVFKTNGIKLLRDASQQATQGEAVTFISEAQAGDLAFFDNEEGVITHVGIVMGEGKIIHASGKVRIDKIDHQGIYNEGLKQYSHKLRLIKRIL
ncbi:MAG: C40 family peptidase [Chlorobi bacterium]|nr:C40 family peptidase [Chlorobiota bacterium]